MNSWCTVSMYSHFFLQYLTNAKNLISSWSVTSTPTLWNWYSSVHLCRNNFIAYLQMAWPLFWQIKRLSDMLTDNKICIVRNKVDYKLIYWGLRSSAMLRLTVLLLSAKLPTASEPTTSWSSKSLPREPQISQDLLRSENFSNGLFKGKKMFEVKIQFSRYIVSSTVNTDAGNHGGRWDVWGGGASEASPTWMIGKENKDWMREAKIININNDKFWVELIAYFPLTVIWVVSLVLRTITTTKNVYLYLYFT
jgi:hypothetical protein